MWGSTSIIGSFPEAVVVLITSPLLLNKQTTSLVQADAAGGEAWRGLFLCHQGAV